MSSELHSTRKQVLELQRQLASERARISIEERRQRSKEAEKEVQEKEVQRRLQRLLSLVAATEGKLRVKPFSSSSRSPLSHLSRTAGGGSASFEGQGVSGSSSLEGLARELERRVGEVLVLALEAQGDLLIAKASSSSSSPPPPTNSSTSSKFHPQATAHSSRPPQQFPTESGVGSKKAVTKDQELDDEPESASVPISPSWKPPRPAHTTPAAPPSESFNPRTSPPIDHLSLRSQGASAAYEQAFVHAASALAISPLSSASAASKAISEAYATAQTASASKPSLLSSNDVKAPLSPPTLRSASYEGAKVFSSSSVLSSKGVELTMESPRAKSLADLYSSPRVFISKDA